MRLNNHSVNIPLANEIESFKKRAGFAYKPNFILDKAVEAKPYFLISEGPLLPQLCDFLDAVHVPRSVMHFCNVYIDGELLEPREWLACNVSAYTRVDIVANVTGGGGGKNVLGIIASVALIAVSSFATWGLSGSGAFLGFKSLGLSSWIGSAAGAAIMIGGGLLFSGMFRQKTPSLDMGDKGEQNYVMESTHNTSRLYEAQEIVIGRLRTAPSYASAWFSEFVNDTHYWHGLYQVSAGTVKVEDIRIGDTPINQYSGVDCIVYEGWDGEPLKYFDRRREEVNDGAKIDTAGTVVSRETPKGVKSFTLVFSFPAGLFWMKKNGGTQEWPRDLRMAWRKKGTKSWIDFSRSIWGHIKSSFSRSIKINTPNTTNDESYEIRISGPQVTYGREVMDCVLSSMQYEYAEKAINQRKGFKKTIIELRIKASDQLSGNVDQLNCIASSYGLVPDNNGNWNKRITSNPASLALHLMTNGELSKLPYPKDRIDWREWKKFYDFCQKHGWTYAAVRTDGAKRAAVVNDILGAGLGALSMNGNKYSVVWDALNDDYVDTATPQSSWGFELSREYPIHPVHGYRIEFPNKEKNWQLDETVVYADGYNERNAENIIIWKPSDGNRGTSGVDNYNNIYKLARISLASIIHRPETVSWSTGWRSIDYSIGQRIAVSYDTYHVGSGGGNLVAYLGKDDREIAHPTKGNMVHGFKLNDHVNMQRGKTYIARSTKKYSNKIWRLKTIEGAHTYFYFERPIPVETAPELMAPLSVGEAGRDAMICTITGISRSADYTAQITAVPSKGKEILASITGKIPPWNSLITEDSYYDRDGTPKAPYILNMRSDESILQRVYGALVPRIGVAFRIVEKRGVTVDRVRAQYRRRGSAKWLYSSTVDVTEEEVLIGNVIEGEIYEIRLQSISNLDRYSAWSSIASEKVIGMSTPPDDIVNAYYSKGDIKIIYDPPIDFAGYEIFMSYDPMSNGNYKTPFSNQIFTTSSIHVGDNISGGRSFFIYAVDIAGNRSKNPAVVRVHWEGGIEGNAVEEYDYKGHDWKGKIGGGYIDPISNCIVANGLKHLPFWSGDNKKLFWNNDSNPFWNKQSFAQLNYFFSVDVPEGATLSAKHFLERDIKGDIVSVDYDVSEFNKFWSGTNNNLFWSGSDNKFFWGEPRWTPLPDYLSPLPVILSMRIILAGGDKQGKICELSSIFDYPDIEEPLLELNLKAKWNLVKLKNNFKSIKYADAIIMETKGLDPVEIRKKIVGGQLEVLPLDENNKPTTAKVNLYVRGY